MKNLTILFSALFMCTSAFAQEALPVDSSAQTKTATTEDTKSSKSYLNSAVGVGLLAGTNGPGMQVAYRFGKKARLAARANFTYLPIVIEGYEYYLLGYDFIAGLDAKLSGTSLILDYHPFGNAFKLSGGLCYLQTNLKISAQNGDTLRPGDIYVTPEDFGKLNAEITTNKIVPFMAIGFGRAVPRKRANFGFEIGAYYVGSPNINLKAEGMLEPSGTENEAVIRQNVEAYQWLPQITFHLNFKISK